MRVLINKLLLLSAMLMVTNLWAESEITAEDLPLWLKPELLVHLSAMKMNESQNLEFREALKECLTGMQRVVQREIRKGGVNIPKRIERGIIKAHWLFSMGILLLPIFLYGYSLGLSSKYPIYLCFHSATIYFTL